MSILDQALGTRSKAVIGPGVASVEMYPHISTIYGQRKPTTLMAEAQNLYHTNVWVAAAERAIVSRVLRTPWRLEDENGDTIDEDSGPGAVQLLEHLEHPNLRMSRRTLWEITLRHLGLCGNSFWLVDERSLGDGTGLALVYINPARLTPALADGELLGWVLDSPTNPVTAKLGGTTRPIPLTSDDLLHYLLEADDWTRYGIGIAEAAAAQVQLSGLTTAHATSTMALGGRLTGIVSPKPEAGGPTLNADEWAAVLRDWRQLAGDPDSAKRLQIIRAPIDFTQLAASPADLQLAELRGASRDDILAAWGVPPTQIGVPLASGLNSGEARKYDEAVLWQGSVLTRLDAFRETFQTYLDRWNERLGVDWHIVFDVPSFDDRTPLFDVADKATDQPLTNNERRALMGFDPLPEEDPLGNAIYLPSTLVPVGAPTESTPVTSSDLGKATPASLRQRMENRFVPRFLQAAAGVLADQAGTIAERVESHFATVARKPDDVTAWWDAARWDKAWEAALGELYDDLATATSRNASTLAGKAADPISGVLSLVRGSGAERISGINQATRDAVRDIVSQGLDAGLGPGEIAQNIRDATAFDAARSERIARTETMLAYNESALRTYQNLDVQYVEALDGDADDMCANRVAANPWKVADALGQQDHPNGTLDWSPVTGKAREPMVSAREVELLRVASEAAQRTEVAEAKADADVLDAMREIAARPATTDPALLALLKAVAERPVEVHMAYPEPKPLRKRILRDDDGRIIGMEEVP